MTERTHTRRTVLTTGAAVTGAALGTAALASCSENRTDQNEEPAAPKQNTRLAAVDDVDVGGSHAVTTPEGQEIIVSRPSEDEIVAYSAVCTHQGCTVVPERARLRCPCHSSTFDPFTGEVQGGPADAPLTAVAVTVQDGEIRTA